MTRSSGSRELQTTRRDAVAQVQSAYGAQQLSAHVVLESKLICVVHYVIVAHKFRICVLHVVQSARDEIRVFHTAGSALACLISQT
jgi:hypothetical protein